MDFFKRAEQIKEEIISNRRYFHENAEVGLHMPIAVDYVMKKLGEYGIEAEKCGHGVCAILGRGEKVLLLRADMDALPMKEESGLEFASKTEAAHACGHDLHAAMLLAVARMLKENESELCGRVKFMFQPAEENLLGAKDMIEAGILENPKADAALAVHVAAGKIPVGTYMYNDKSTMMMSSNSFRIDIKGKGGHGAYPGLAISPINIGVDICTKINNLTKEAMADGKSFITIGRFSSGTVSNIIPEEAIIEGSLRSKDNDVRLKQLEQIYEIAENTAKNAGGQATITILSDVPPLVCDTGFTGEIVQMIEDMNKTGMFIGGEQRQGFLKAVSDMEANASDDFACIAEKIPAAYIYLSAGFDDERGDFTAHNSRVIFDENVCATGAALMAECAMKWLVLGN